MIKATLVITDEAVSVSYVNADSVTLSVTQGASLWEADGADRIKPKGAKIVGADYVDLSGKVDVVAGKELSDNNYTDAEVAKLASLENYDDTAVLAALSNKVDKVTGKELSDNNYTDIEVVKVGYIDGSGDGDMALADDGSYRLFSPLTGFNAPDSVVVSYDSTTRKITLSGTVSATYNGEVVAAITSGWVSDAHADVAGTYFLYYDGSFHFGTNPWTFDSIQIASVVYGGDKFGLRECHGNVMSAPDHEEAHQTIGTYKIAGGDFTDYTLASTTAANRRPLISETTIKDEDLKTVLPALTTETYTRRYMTGASTREFDIDQTDIVSVTGAIPNWNQFTGGAWTQTAFTANQYGAVFVAAIPVTSDATSQKYRYIFVQPQTVSTTLSVIQALTPSSLVLGDSATLAQEFCFIGKIIVQYIGPATNNWVLTSVEKLEGTKISQVAITSSPPSASSVAFTPAGDVVATNVQSAIEELDTEIGFILSTLTTAGSPWTV